MQSSLYYCLIFLAFFSYMKKESITNALNKISFEDKCFMESFFRTLISSDSGSYVLFGDKPASVMFFENWQKGLCSDSPNMTFSDFSPEKKGYAVWKKHEFSFLSKEYTIIKTKAFNPEFSEAVFLIHKKRLLKILKQNFSAFQKVFPQYTSPKDLWDVMLNDPEILHDICFKSDYLFGIILGYGSENAKLFARESEILNFLNRGARNFCLKKPKPQQGFKSFEEELQAIDLKGKSLINPTGGITWMLHFPLSYLVDETHTSVAKLRAKYRKQLKAATQAYEKGNFLESTIYYLSG